MIADDDNAVLIDVRTPEECSQGMIPGAININLMSPEFMDSILELDRNKNYYMICRSGGRSATAAGAMANNGFKSLVNFQGGMLSWDGELEMP
ncbi:MAG: rhodanese [Crocinitomicaceae bacterium]|nr:rhodanese [Crocinitomicaceae bacterium]